MSLRLNGSTSGYVEIDAPAVAGNNTLRLPTTNGTDGSVLQVDSTGQLAWRDGNSLGTGFKNRIVNGAMLVSQRNAGNAISRSGSGYSHNLDQWYGGGINSSAVFSIQQVADAPTGFSRSIRYTVTTADSSFGASEETGCQQNIEGYSVDDLGWGTANARAVTLSFWVKCSLTGTFGVGVRNTDNWSRSYVGQYSINTANTWEYKSILIPGPTDGVWGTVNQGAVNITFDHGAGSNFNGTPGVWNNSGATRAAGNTSLCATLNATWQLTGVQLEVGTTPTAFERLSWHDELSRCQRYLESSFNIGQPFANGVWTAAYLANVPYADQWVLCVPRIEFKVRKRAAPVITTYGSNGLWQVNNNSNGWDTLAVIGTSGFQGMGPISTTGFSLGIHNNGSSGYPVGYAKALRGDWVAESLI